MKKLVAIVLLLLALVCLLVACGEDHTHCFGEWMQVIAPTCTKAGEQTRSCACGEKETQSVDTLPHTWGEWSVLLAPTCANEGESVRTCTCGAKDKKAIAATGEHDYHTDNVCKVCQYALEYTKALSYGLNEDGTSYMVSSANATPKNVIIPPYYMEKPVTKVADNGFAEYTSLISIELPASVTEIGAGAFNGCTKLESVKLSKSSQLKSIAPNAFFRCAKLKEIMIPASVNEIGSKAFLACDALETVYITDIAKWCEIQFEDNRSNPLYNEASLYCNNEVVTTLEIPENVAFISNYAFMCCTSLESLVLPQSLRDIGSCAFQGCTELREVKMSEGVLSIGGYAFASCLSLRSAQIPASVVTIGGNPFASCYQLEEIVVESGNKVYHSSENCLIYTASGTLISGCKNSIIPAYVTEIANYAFERCVDLLSVTIPAGVESIGGKAFYSCQKLVEVYNLSKLNITKKSTENGYVGYYAKDVYTSASATSKLFVDDNGYCFYDDGVNCYLLTYAGKETVLNLPIDCKGQPYELYRYAFYQRGDITAVIIPNNAKCSVIGAGAFFECRSLTSIVISSPINSIEEYAFSGCAALKEAVFEKTTGWHRCQTANAETGPTISASELDDSADAAECLTSTYRTAFWKRIAE